VKVPAKQLQAETAGDRKQNFLLSQSTTGRQGVIAGVAIGFEFLGAGHRVRIATAFVGEELTDMCLGHCILGALIFHEALFHIHADVPHGSSGPDIYSYQSWVNMVIAHDSFLRKDNAADRELFVADGADPLRADFEAEYMALPVHQEMGLATHSEVGGVAVQIEHPGAAAAEVPEAAPSRAPAATAVAAPVEGNVPAPVAEPVASTMVVPVTAPAAAFAAVSAATGILAAAPVPMAVVVAARLGTATVEFVAAGVAAPVAPSVAPAVGAPAAASAAPALG